MDVVERKFFDIHIDDEINVSSTSNYHVRVFYKVHGAGGIFREGRDYWLENQWFLGKGKYLDFWLTAPAYLTAAVNRQLVEALRAGRIKFFEYDRDKNKRYDNLRYHEPEAVEWLIKILS